MGGGSFYTLKLLSSNLLGIPLFQSGLSRVQLQSFESHKLFFNTFLENVPQVAIQLYFVFTFGLVTDVVIVSTLSSLCNIILTIKSSIISHVTSKDVHEFPFTLNLSWKLRGVSRIGAVANDPFQRVGRRSALAKELFRVSGDSTPFDFELLAANRTMTGAAIYGTVRMEDQVCVNEEREANLFFQDTVQIKEAVIRAFRYRSEFTSIYDFDVKVTTRKSRFSVSDQVQSFLYALTKESLWAQIKAEMQDEFSGDAMQEIFEEVRGHNVQSGANSNHDPADCAVAERQELHGLLDSEDESEI